MSVSSAGSSTLLGAPPPPPRPYAQPLPHPHSTSHPHPRQQLTPDPEPHTTSHEAYDHDHRDDHSARSDASLDPPHDHEDDLLSHDPQRSNKQKRATLACHPCRRGKRGCDGGMPCSNCQDRGAILLCRYNVNHSDDTYDATLMRTEEMAVPPILAMSKPAAAPEHQAHLLTIYERYAFPLNLAVPRSAIESLPPPKVQSGIQVATKYAVLALAGALETNLVTAHRLQPFPHPVPTLFDKDMALPPWHEDPAYQLGVMAQHWAEYARLQLQNDRGSSEEEEVLAACCAHVLLAQYHLCMGETGTATELCQVALARAQRRLHLAPAGVTRAIGSSPRADAAYAHTLRQTLGISLVGTLVSASLYAYVPPHFLDRSFLCVNGEGSDGLIALRMGAAALAGSTMVSRGGLLQAQTAHRTWRESLPLLWREPSEAQLSQARHMLERAYVDQAPLPTEEACFYFDYLLGQTAYLLLLLHGRKDDLAQPLAAHLVSLFEGNSLSEMRLTIPLLAGVGLILFAAQVYFSVPPSSLTWWAESKQVVPLDRGSPTLPDLMRLWLPAHLAPVVLPHVGEVPLTLFRWRTAPQFSDPEFTHPERKRAAPPPKHGRKPSTSTRGRRKMTPKRGMDRRVLGKRKETSPLYEPQTRRNSIMVGELQVQSERARQPAPPRVSRARRHSISDRFEPSPFHARDGAVQFTLASYHLPTTEESVPDPDPLAPLAPDAKPGPDQGLPSHQTLVHPHPHAHGHADGAKYTAPYGASHPLTGLTHPAQQVTVPAGSPEPKPEPRPGRKVEDHRSSVAFLLNSPLPPT